MVPVCLLAIIYFATIFFGGTHIKSFFHAYSKCRGVFGCPGKVSHIKDCILKGYHGVPVGIFRAKKGQT